MSMFGMADTVTMPGEMRPRLHDPERIVRHTRAMQQRYRQRDGRWDNVRAIRRGELENTPFQEYISEMFEKPIVANTIDTCARDLAEMLAPLPAFNCTSVSMRTDAERKRADVRTRIAGHYVNYSQLARQQLYVCDQYFTHSFGVYYVEADRKARMPRMVGEDPYGGYPEYDRWHRCSSYTKRWYIDSAILADLYPEFADRIISEKRDYAGNSYEVQCELIRYWDKTGRTLVLANKSPIVLEHIPNTIPNKMPLVIIRKPWLDPLYDKGQYDDVLWVQMAKDGLAKLQYEGVTKAVQAPLVAPNDVTEIPYGGDAIMRSANPEKIRRVGMEMTNMTFIENQSLSQELLDGARYPAARATGSMAGSIVTGRAVQALQGGLESQIKAGQVIFREAFIDLIALCFEMDEHVWGNTKKEISGHSDGSPYALSYTPNVDIKGKYDIDVQYGFAAGLDPNRAAVLLLQMRADDVISRDYMARQQPFALNVTEEQSKILAEKTRDAISQGIFAVAQAIPAMAQMGVSPAQTIQQLATFSKRVQRGDSAEDAALAAFAPPAPPPGQEDNGVPGAPNPGPGGPGGPGGTVGGLNPSGLMQGVAPGQAGAPPGGKPDLSIAMAGLTSTGKPQMSNSVSRRRAV